MQQGEAKKQFSKGARFHHKNRGPLFVTRIKFKRNGRTYYYNSNKLNLRVGDKCVVEGEKGLEFGTVAMAKRKTIQSRRKKPLRKILRQATPEDLKKIEENERLERDALQYCQEKIKEREIPMKLTRVEFDFNAERGTFYFSAEGRVDFRELVKDLAQHFKTKIEMWQIGVRDEARISGGCGICGRSLCCSSFLRDFEPVSIRMAKDQNLSLNPAKISGACGRLMCCLVYEHKNYCEFKKCAPRVGRAIETPEGKGRIVETNMLLGRVTVELEEGKKIHMKIGELPPPQKKEENRQPPVKNKNTK